MLVCTSGFISGWSAFARRLGCRCPSAKRICNLSSNPLQLYEFEQIPLFLVRNHAFRVPENQPGTAVAWVKPIAYDLRHTSLPTLMTSRQANQQEDTYFRVMRILHDSPDITQRELAGRLGLSVSGLNYCLKALIDKGWVKIQNFSNNRNKLGYAYLLTPAGIVQKASLTGRFLQRKMQEYEVLKQEIQQMKQEVNGQS